MVKQRPPDNLIPTLRDIVFPGDARLRIQPKSVSSDALDYVEAETKQSPRNSSDPIPFKHLFADWDSHGTSPIDKKKQENKEDNTTFNAIKDTPHPTIPAENDQELDEFLNSLHVEALASEKTGEEKEEDTDKLPENRSDPAYSTLEAKELRALVRQSLEDELDDLATRITEKILQRPPRKANYRSD